MWTDYLAWNWKGDAIRVGYDLLGKGPTLLLLPALSSISTRHEMRPLQERLASAFSTITIDWPGFGDLPHAETMKRLFLVQTVPFVFPILEPSGVSATIKRLDARGTRDKRAPHIRDLIS